MWDILPIFDYKTPNKRNFFDPVVRKIKIKESYNVLNLRGEFWIYSRATLPQFSYYLNCSTAFGNFENIPLIYKDRYLVESNNILIPPLCYIDLYYFNFDINLNKWSNFNNKISNMNFKLNFNFIFNQNVIKDFNMNIIRECLDGFLTEVNLSNIWWNCNYANYFVLEKPILSQNINLISQEDYISIKVLDWNNNTKTMIDTFCKFVSSKLLWVNDCILELEFTNEYNQTNKQEFKMKQLGINNQYDACFCFDNWYEYDLKENIFKKGFINKKGLFSAHNLKVKATLTLKCIIDELYRTIKYISDFNFDNKSLNILLEQINIQYLNNNFNNYETIDNY